MRFGIRQIWPSAIFIINVNFWSEEHIFNCYFLQPNNPYSRVFLTNSIYGLVQEIDFTNVVQVSIQNKQIK